MEIYGPDISKYRVVVTNGFNAKIVGLVEKTDVVDAPLNLASIGRSLLTPEMFEALRGLRFGVVGGSHLAHAGNIHAQ